MNNPDIIRHNIVSIDVLQFTADIDCDFYKNELYKIRSIDSKGVKKSNKGGYQTPDKLNYEPSFFLLIQYLNKKIEDIFKRQSIITGLWGNISSTGHCNDVHTHTETPNYSPDNNLFSGVIYLQTPPNSGAIIFRHPLNINTCYEKQPFPNCVYLFPNYCPHGVDPNFSNQDRISIAFNFSIN